MPQCVTNKREKGSGGAHNKAPDPEKRFTPRDDNTAQDLLSTLSVFKLKVLRVVEGGGHRLFKSPPNKRVRLQKCRDRAAKGQRFQSTP